MTMTKPLLAILMLLPLATFCQRQDTIKPKQISIGVSFSPDYCYRYFKSNPSDNFFQEIPALGFTTGLNFIYNLNNRMCLESGLLFFDKGEKTKKTDLIFDPPNPNTPTKGTFIWHDLYLGIPIKINYYVLTQRTRIYLSAGISVNPFLVEKHTAIYEFADGHTSILKSASNSGFHRIDVCSVAGFGISYGFSERLAVKVEPTYRRFLTSTIYTPFVKGHFYSVGLNFGVNYKI